MKRLIAISMLCLSLLALSVSMLYASAAVDDQGNPNDPKVNERANACYAGGTLAGKCDTPLLWEAGWYLIRYEAAMLVRGAFPAHLVWVLGEEDQGPVDMTCYIEVTPNGYQYASPTVLNGGNEGDFEWFGDRLTNTFSDWIIWDQAWQVGYYGDCSPLGIGSPAPDDLVIVE
jgi:hypothetical protein